MQLVTINDHRIFEPDINDIEEAFKKHQQSKQSKERSAW